MLKTNFKNTVLTSNKVKKKAHTSNHGHEKCLSRLKYLINALHKDYKVRYNSSHGCAVSLAPSENYLHSPHLHITTEFRIKLSYKTWRVPKLVFFGDLNSNSWE